MKILVVDDEAPARYGMVKAIQQNEREVMEAYDGESALEMIRSWSPDLVFLDLNMPGADGVSVLKNLQQDSTVATPEIIVVTANNDVSLAVDCIQFGATDFITKPYEVEHLRSIVRRTEKRVRLQHQVTDLQQRGAVQTFGAILGASRPMRTLFSQLEKAAKTSLPVLVRGESGTGKELVAQELHERSDRAGRPFVAVNTAAIATSLVESELFGHVRGAFTGADRDREGVFRQADGGTLFLDEIGDMPAEVQTRLLRVLQEGIVQPVGTERSVPVDVRVISATHQDLESAIDSKSFRQDLYFRLKGIELAIPPLRTRQEDILLLAHDFVPDNVTFSPEAVTVILQHTWPGNVRELQQTVRAAATLCEEDVISPQDLGLCKHREPRPGHSFEAYLEMPLSEAKSRLMEDFERHAIVKALDEESHNISAAARRLGIHRQSLQQKMKSLDIP